MRAAPARAGSGDAALPSRGLPLVPPGFEWLRRDGGEPLALLAEIFLDEVPAVSGQDPLPAHGVLQVWFDAENMPMAEPGGGSVRWLEDVAALEPLGQAPEGVEPFSRMPVRCERRVSVLGSSQAWQHLGGRDNADDAFCAEIARLQAIAAELAVGMPVPLDKNGEWDADAYDRTTFALEGGHQLLGHMTTIQDECFDPGERLLVQIVSEWDDDEGSGWSFADGGHLWFHISPGDLAARRFEKASYSWSCS